ncbi:MAG: hypothetical protein BRD21_08740 [Halobacteriales archaeon SW_8_66_22]|nr:MAG: hypothetical protein BRD21_08740 [Halobacteriales archaeon SW_8_66_22]
MSIHFGVVNCNHDYTARCDSGQCHDSPSAGYSPDASFGPTSETARGHELFEEREGFSKVVVKPNTPYDR